MRSHHRLASLAAAAAAAGALTWAVLVLMPPDRWQTTFWPRWGVTLGFTALFALGAFSFGCRVVDWLTPVAGRDGAGALAWVTGVLFFGLFLGGFGLFGLLGAPLFWLLPLGMGLWGLKASAPRGVRWFERLRDETSGWSAAQLGLLVIGALAVAVLVPQVFSPDNVNFDARWYHLRAAHRYALAGGQVRTPEGDYLLALPQLASWLYTWAFLAPLPTLAEKVQLALHLELVTVLVTLLTIPPLARALMPGLPRDASRLGWVAFFFFPSLYVYDTGLFGGADHVAAMWAAPMVLTWLQARSRGDARSWVLWGVVTTGALAKYTSIFLVVPLAGLALADWAWRFRGAGRVARFGPFLAGATTMALAAPWWLRNWAWYHDPVYPVAARLFGAQPWTTDAVAILQRHAVQINFVVGGLPVRAREWTLWGTGEALLDYWRELYTWGDFTGGQPVFGFAFLLSVVVLPFLRGARGLWFASLLCHLGIAAWFNVKHEMRYLSILAPVMAAQVAAVAATLWRAGRPELRVVVLAAVVAQGLVFGELPFRRTHRLNGHRSPFEKGLELVAAPSTGTGVAGLWPEVNKVLPPRALPLVHGMELAFGLERQSVTDIAGLQFGLSYARLGSLPALHQKLRDLGVTHLVTTAEAEQQDSLAGEALFRAYSTRTVNHRQIGPYLVGELPAEPPADPGDALLYVGCAGLVPTGLYTLADLSAPLSHWPAPLAEVKPRVEAPAWQALLPHATYVVLEDGCGLPVTPPAPEFVPTGLQKVPVRAWRHYLRVSGTALPW